MTTRVEERSRPKLAQRLVGDDHAAAAGGFGAAFRSAEVDGLAGDHRGLGVAGVHGIGVHDPGHGLLIGVHVGRGDVFFGADEFEQFGGVAAGDALEFARARAGWGRR